jgi:hypothetical protein
MIPFFKVGTDFLYAKYLARGNRIETSFLNDVNKIPFFRFFTSATTVSQFKLIEIKTAGGIPLFDANNSPVAQTTINLSVANLKSSVYSTTRAWYCNSLFYPLKYNSFYYLYVKFSNNEEFRSEILKTPTIVTVPQNLNDDLILYAPFYGNANNEAATAIGNGTVSGATLTTDKNGLANSAYLFDATNDRIVYANNDLFEIENNIFTITFWCRKTSSNVLQTILAKGESTDFSGEYVVYFSGLDLKIDVIDTVNLALQTTTVAGAISLNTWAFIGIVCNNTPQNVETIQVDGSSRLLTKSPDAGFVKIRKTVTNLTVGSMASSNYFGGTIDNVRLYKRALTSNELNTIYNNYI